MPIVWAGMAAAFFGVADFMGGTAARRMNPLLVAALAQVGGFLMLLFLALAVFPAPWLAQAALWGGLAGMAGGIGIPMLYRSLAIGPMNVVAPLTALTSSVVPVIAGVALGERPAPLAWLGIVLAVIAGVVVGVSATPAPDAIADPGTASDRPHTAAPHTAAPNTAAPRAAAGVILGVLAGLCFGGFYVLLAQAAPGAGIWPVTAARFVGALVIAVVMLCALRGRLRTPEGLGVREVSWRGWRLAALCGVLDASANALYLVAVQHGQLSVIGSIMGLYPATTVLLARVLHGERIGRVQRVGLLLAVPAMVLVGGG